MREYSTTDISSTKFWSTPAAEREQSFALLRKEEPISWQRPSDGGLMPLEDDDGFWGVVRHADVTFVSKHPELFCSGKGVQLENVPEVFLEATQSFLAMDAPRHTLLRKLVGSAFTPRRVAALDAAIAAHAERIVTDLLAAGGGDFVALVAARLPMWTIYEMVGLPSEQRQSVARWAAMLVSGIDEQVHEGRPALELIGESVIALATAGLELAAARRTHPQDDLMTNLVQAEVDGARLTDAEISAFFVLLSVAGNDTTRNTISHGISALQRFPEQREWLLADFDARIGSAAEEFLRWGSAVLTFKRTATQDTELSGVPIAAGDKVVLFYPAANWDTDVFTAPERLDLSRTPNKHVSFGAGGPHFCLGAALARTQLRSMFGQLLHRVPDLRVGEPDLLVSNFVHGVKHLPCTTS